MTEIVTRPLKTKVLISKTFNPWFNLATEDYIFRDMDTDYQILFLWRNDQTVVIGRFQNPWTECHTQKMDTDGIFLARRQSGGGAVFQDLGNTNFTFMSSKKTYSKENNNTIILNSLKRFGVNAVASGRNDINVDDKKISGSAFKETIDRAFHHGTLLINTDLQKLGQYLNPHPKKLASKGIQSVKARVANLIEFNPDIDHEKLSEAIVKEFTAFYGVTPEIEILNEDHLKKIENLALYYEKLKDWNWRFGETPQFNHQMAQYFSWGLVDVHIASEKGIISQIKIFSDSLHPEMIEILTARLAGIFYDSSAINDVCIKLGEEYKMYQEYLNEFGEWLKGEVA